MFWGGFWKGRLKSIFLNEENAAHRTAYQLRAQHSGSQLERRSKGASEWSLFCPGHKKTSKQSGLCSDMEKENILISNHTVFCNGTKSNEYTDVTYESYGEGLTE